MAEKLTDEEALDRMRRAADVLGTEPGQSVRSDTALKAARLAMVMLLFSLEQAVDDDSDEIAAITKPALPPEL